MESSNCPILRWCQDCLVHGTNFTSKLDSSRRSLDTRAIGDWRNLFGQEEREGQREEGAAARPKRRARSLGQVPCRAA